MTNNATANEPITRMQAAKLAGVNSRTITRWVSQGLLPFNRDHRTGRPSFEPEDVLRVAATQRALRIAVPKQAQESPQDSNKTGKTAVPETPA